MRAARPGRKPTLSKGLPRIRILGQANENRRARGSNSWDKATAKVARGSRIQDKTHLLAACCETEIWDGCNKGVRTQVENLGPKPTLSKGLRAQVETGTNTHT
jgi:hypothetical protein